MAPAPNIRYQCEKMRNLLFSNRQNSRWIRPVDLKEATIGSISCRLTFSIGFLLKNYWIKNTQNMRMLGGIHFRKANLKTKKNPIYFLYTNLGV